MTRPSGRRLWALIVVALATLLAAPAALAQEQPVGLSINVRAGYDGAYRSGEWFPISLDIANDGRDIQGVVEWSFPGQRNEPAFRRAVDLPRGSRKRVTIDAFSRGFARNGQVRLIENGTTLYEQGVSLTPIDPDRFVAVVVSSDPALLNSLAALQIDGSSGTEVRHIQPAELPAQAATLRGVNTLFLHDVDTTALLPEQRTALAGWVSLGGQLVVGGGVGGEQVAAGLADLLPITLAGTIAEGDLSPLGASGGSAPVPERGPISAVSARPGAEEVIPGSGLLYRWSLGAGSVLFAAFDLALLRGWGGEPTMWGAALDPQPIFVPGLGARVNQISPLQDVLQLPALGLPSAGALAAFLLAYVLIIGPVNFLLLRRLRRLEWAWVSVPLTVLLFAAALYVAGVGLRGGQSQLHTVAVVQSAEGQPRALSTAFVGMFSPLRSTYSLRFPPDSLVSETRGFDEAPVRPVQILAADDGVSVDEVLVDVASVRMLMAETPIDTPVQVESAIRDEGGALRGELRNTGAVAIEDALLVRDGSFVDLGTLAPGASVAVDLSRPQRNFPYAVRASEEGLFNRRQLLTRLFSSDLARFAPTGSTGSALDEQGLYLIGWSESAPLPIAVNGEPARQSGLTLYVIRLRA